MEIKIIEFLKKVDTIVLPFLSNTMNTIILVIVAILLAIFLYRRIIFKETKKEFLYAAAIIFSANYVLRTALATAISEEVQTIELLEIILYAILIKLCFKKLLNPIRNTSLDKISGEEGDTTLNREGSCDNESNNFKAT